MYCDICLGRISGAGADTVWGGGDPRTHKIGLPWWNSWSWIESLAGATSVVQLNQAQAGFLPEYVMLGLPWQDS